MWRKKSSVLADMKELGDQSVQLHNHDFEPFSPDVLYCDFFYGQDIAQGAQLASQMFPIGHLLLFKKTEDQDQFEDLVEQVKESLGAHDQILLKGSLYESSQVLVESLK